MQRVLQMMKAACGCLLLSLAGCATLTEGTLPPDLNSPNEAIIVTALGDVSFATNRNLRTAESKGAWSHYTLALRPLLNGNFNFANLESVVTDQSLGNPVDKEFVFQMHTTGLAHLVEDLKLNLLSIANNHTGDFGREGQLATRKALSRYNGQILYHGLGTTAELSNPAVGQNGQQDIAFAALGISADAPRPSGELPGQWNVHVKPDWDKTLNGLANSSATLKILSLHEGIERQQELEPNLRNRYRRAQAMADLDLIVSHHPHVARGLEIDVKGRVIAYGLGNGMLHGAADIRDRGAAADFGLLLRLYYRGTLRGPVLEAVEAIPLTFVHSAPRTFTPAASQARIDVLNQLSRQTSQERALILRPHAVTGFGIWCSAVLQTRQAQALCG